MPSCVELMSFINMWQLNTVHLVNINKLEVALFFLYYKNKITLSFHHLQGKNTKLHISQQFKFFPHDHLQYFRMRFKLKVSGHVLTLDRLLTRKIHDCFKMAFFRVKLSKFEQKLSRKMKTTLTLRDARKDNLVPGLSFLIGQAHLKGNPLIRVQSMINHETRSCLQMFWPLQADVYRYVYFHVYLMISPFRRLLKYQVFIPILCSKQGRKEANIRCKLHRIVFAQNVKCSMQIFPVRSEACILNEFARR